MKSSHFLYNSDICRTTSVSAADDQTSDSYIAVIPKIRCHWSGEMRLMPLPEDCGSRPTTATGGCVATSQELLNMYQRHLSNYFCFRHRRSNSWLLYRRIYCQKYDVIDHNHKHTELKPCRQKWQLRRCIHWMYCSPWSETKSSLCMKIGSFHPAWNPDPVLLCTLKQIIKSYMN